MGGRSRLPDQSRVAAIYARVSSERQRQDADDRKPDRRAA